MPDKLALFSAIAAASALLATAAQFPLESDNVNAEDIAGQTVLLEGRAQDLYVKRREMADNLEVIELGLRGLSAKRTRIDPGAAAALPPADREKIARQQVDGLAAAVQRAVGDAKQLRAKVLAGIADDVSGRLRLDAGQWK
jgi:hypothetical protein